MSRSWPIGRGGDAAHDNRHKKCTPRGGNLEAFDVEYVGNGRSETFDAIILLQNRVIVKGNRAAPQRNGGAAEPAGKCGPCRKGGEIDMTTTLTIIGVCTVVSVFMRIIEALDAPRDRRRKA